MAKVLALEEDHNNTEFGSFWDDILQAGKQIALPKYIRIKWNYMPDFVIPLDFSNAEKQSGFMKKFLELTQPEIYIMFGSGDTVVYDYKTKKIRKVQPDIRLFQPPLGQRLLTSPLFYIGLLAGVGTLLYLAFKRRD